MTERWNPWSALRTRPHITLQWAVLRNARGMWTPHGDGTSTIYLDHRLGRRERRCVLAHELVHDERGISYDRATPRLLVDIEERTVTRETVRRLVPLAALAALVMATSPEPLEVWEIADHFDVDWRTARAAVALVG
jgi:hypothetical protein